MVVDYLKDYNDFLSTLLSLSGQYSIDRPYIVGGIVKDSHAIGGATWNALTSINGGGNSGWTFAQIISKISGFFNLFF